MDGWDINCGLTNRQIVELFNIAYAQGHNDTVEGVATPAISSEDFKTENIEICFEAVKELKEEGLL